MIEPARKIFKQLTLMEDAMLIHRIMRAPEKRIFYTDIGNIPPAEVDNYMEKMMSLFSGFIFVSKTDTKASRSLYNPIQPYKRLS